MVALACLLAAAGQMYMSIGPDGVPVVTDYPRERAVDYAPGDFERIALGQTGRPHRGLDVVPQVRVAPREIESLLVAASARHGVPLALLRAVVAVESNFKSDAISRAGAMGLMQLMPGTAKDMGVKNALQPEDNVNGGARYLAFLLKHFKDTTLALAAYNAGPGRVQRAGGVPDIAETKAYIVNVLGLAQAYEGILPR